MKFCKKHWKKIVGLVLILICGIQLFRYVFPPFETVPSTIDVYEGDDIELDIKYSPGIHERTIHYETYDEVEHYWGKYEFTLHNNTSKDMTYGVGYLLQVKRGLKWESVKSDIFSVLVALDLPAGSSVSGDLNIDFEYGKLPVGKYRIVKDVSPYDSVRTKYNIAGEFRVWF